MSDTVFLNGKNIYLRPPELNDASIFGKWFNDPEIRKYISNRFPYSLFIEEELIKNINSEKNVFLVICEKKSKKAIGNMSININWVNRRAMLGIIIGEIEFQNKGYGKEAMVLMLDYAFSELNLHKIVLEVYDFNKKALSLYKKLGFKREGHFKKHSFKEGKYMDLTYMGLLEKEWQKYSE
ncbi:GNAT family N-acetyltransferase [bacterium]|nr:GNAT family N-acetyltransferase [bacterium]